MTPRTHFYKFCNKDGHLCDGEDIDHEWYSLLIGSKHAQLAQLHLSLSLLLPAGRPSGGGIIDVIVKSGLGVMFVRSILQENGVCRAWVSALVWGLCLGPKVPSILLVVALLVGRHIIWRGNQILPRAGVCRVCVIIEDGRER